MGCLWQGSHHPGAGSAAGVGRRFLEIILFIVDKKEVCV
jgi:hypothetical protein